MVDSALPSENPESAAAQPGPTDPDGRPAAAAAGEAGLGDPAAVDTPTTSEPPLAAEPPTVPADTTVTEVPAPFSQPQPPAASLEPPAPAAPVDGVISAPPSPPTATPSVEPPPPPAPNPPVPEPAPAAGVETTVTVPPLEEGAAAGEGGGEFELLISRFSQWLQDQNLTAKWEGLQGPLRGLALLLVALVALRLYGALLDTLEGLPLVPRLLQLVGLVTLLQFSLANLLRSSDREQLRSRWQQRWASFRGRP